MIPSSRWKARKLTCVIFPRRNFISLIPAISLLRIHAISSRSESRSSSVDVRLQFPRMCFSSEAAERIDVMSFPENTTVVAVHGAWADGSSWEAVISPLLKQGLKVIAAPIPLTSLSDDAAALKRVIARTDGPVIVAGHAYAGAVVATASDERVKALVYVAALAPDEGETVAQVFYKDESHPKAPHLQPDADGLIWMPEEGFQNA